MRVSSDSATDPPQPCDPSVATTVAFGPFELELGSCLLTRQGLQVSLRPAAARTLVFLVRQAGTLASREALREYLWGESFVEWQTGLHQCIRQVRSALGDDARCPRYVETVPRRGYRFIAEVRRHRSGPVAAPPPTGRHRRRWGGFLAGVAATLAVPATLLLICALLAT